MQWNANYRVVEITKLNTVKPAYCQAEDTDKKMSKFWSGKGHVKGNQIGRPLRYFDQRCVRFSCDKVIKMEKENFRSVKIQKHVTFWWSWNASQKEVAVFLEM